MSPETLLAIARFENRNVCIPWRVTGSINRVRIRMRSTLILLPNERLREAEDAFRKLEGPKHSLLFHLDYAFTSASAKHQQRTEYLRAAFAEAHDGAIHV